MLLSTKFKPTLENDYSLFLPWSSALLRSKSHRTQLAAVATKARETPERIWHKEVGAPMSLDRWAFSRLCPHAPGFLNLRPGTWTGAPPLRHL